MFCGRVELCLDPERATRSCVEGQVWQQPLDRHARRRRRAFFGPSQKDFARPADRDAAEQEIAGERRAPWRTPFDLVGHHPMTYHIGSFRAKPPKRNVRALANGHKLGPVGLVELFFRPVAWRLVAAQFTVSSLPTTGAA